MTITITLAHHKRSREELINDTDTTLLSLGKRCVYCGKASCTTSSCNIDVVLHAHPHTQRERERERKREGGGTVVMLEQQAKSISFQ